MTGHVCHYLTVCGINRKAFQLFPAAVLFNAFKYGLCLDLEAFGLNEHRNGLITVLYCAHDHVRAFGEKYSVPVPEITPELILGDSCENVHLRIVNVFYRDEIHLFPQSQR